MISGVSLKMSAIYGRMYLGLPENAGHIYDNTDKPLEKMIHEMELNDYKVFDITAVGGDYVKTQTV